MVGEVCDVNIEGARRRLFYKFLKILNYLANRPKRIRGTKRRDAGVSYIVSRNSFSSDDFTYVRIGFDTSPVFRGGCKRTLRFDCEDSQTNVCMM